MAIKLYSGPLSLFSRKVEIALGEKGLEFERKFVPFTQSKGYAPKPAAVLDNNPKAQVPVLMDSDVTLFDSTVIFEYLEDKYPDPPLYPAGAAERARCRMFELEADEVMLPPLVKLMYRTEPAHNDPNVRHGQEEAGARAEKAIAGQLQDLDAVLAERTYLCGAFTFANIATFMSVLFNLRLGGPTLDEFPHLGAWYERMLARPPVAKTAAEVAQADEDLKGS